MRFTKDVKTDSPREFYYTFNNGPSHLSLCDVTFDLNLKKFPRKKLLQKKLLFHIYNKKRIKTALAHFQCIYMNYYKHYASKNQGQKTNSAAAPTQNMIDR